jgi:hypothetical protein
MTSKNSARLDRVYDKLARRFPRFGGFLHWVRRPSSRLLRIPLGLLLILGGIFSFLPVLGIWMLPLGLILLAVDFPPLQRPVAWAIIKGEHWLIRRRRRKRQKATNG